MSNEINTNGWSRYEKFVLDKIETILEEIKDIKKSFKEEQEEQDKRITSLERFRWIGTGVIFVIIFFKDPILKYLHLL